MNSRLRANMAQLYNCAHIRWVYNTGFTLTGVTCN